MGMGADQLHDWRASIASALEWWRDAGVDCEIADAPRDWLARALPVDKLPAAVRETGDAPVALPDTLDAFLAWRAGDAAPEARWPGQAMGPQGSIESALMVLVDMPDRDDEAAGELLSGAAGRLFDRMLAAIGRDRQSIYLTGVATKRPPAGRLAEDVALELATLVRHHVSLARPKRLLALGNAASRAIAGTDVTSARGSLLAVNHAGGTVSVVASFHPRFLLERPAGKADAWRDLRLLIGGFE